MIPSNNKMFLTNKLFSYKQVIYKVLPQIEDKFQI